MGYPLLDPALDLPARLLWVLPDQALPVHGDHHFTKLDRRSKPRHHRAHDLGLLAAKPRFLTSR